MANDALTEDIKKIIRLAGSEGKSLRLITVRDNKFWRIYKNEKNSELTYKEMYQQPASFQAVNDTLEDIFKTLDKVFFW